jgi:hypothetical protein
MKLPARVWGYLDEWSHRLHAPGPVRDWICHRYDVSLGLYDEDDIKEEE